MMPHLHMKNMSLFAVVSSLSFSFKEQLQFIFEKHYVFTLLSRMSGLVAEGREVKKIAHTCLIFSVSIKVRYLFVLSRVDLERRTKAYKAEGNMLVLFYCCIYQFKTTPKYR